MVSYRRKHLFIYNLHWKHCTWALKVLHDQSVSRFEALLFNCSFVSSPLMSSSIKILFLPLGHIPFSNFSNSFYLSWLSMCRIHLLFRCLIVTTNFVVFHLLKKLLPRPTLVILYAHFLIYNPNTSSVTTHLSSWNMFQNHEEGAMFWLNVGQFFKFLSNHK